MPRNLQISAPDFETAFQELLGAKRELSEDVDAAVSAILHEVQKSGDAAVVAYTNRFDRMNITAADLEISRAEINAEADKCSPEAIAALETAADRIRSYHERMLPEGFSYTDETGVTLGSRWGAVDAAGLYVPGGTAAYPSSVLMNAIPAKVAGVERLVMVVPTPDGFINPIVMAAARLAGVDQVFRIGGAQAVAALAYGTETIQPVDKIVGPGNAFVAAAKRRVFGTVGIDMIAGPSEILVVADGQNDPDWIAVDLLSQAEHDTSAQSILITDDSAFAGRVEEAIQRRLSILPRREIAQESWTEHGAVITVKTLDEAVPLIDRIAPEHLELAVEDPDALAAKVRHAGAIFLGRFTPEAIGDYIAGPNHVLPTSRSARFSSGLGVLDFMKRTSLVSCTADALGALSSAAVTLAEAEGLDAHARSIDIRTNH